MQVWCTSILRFNLVGCRNGKLTDPIKGQVDRASATEAVDSGSIPGSLLDVQQLKGQCKASTVCGKHGDRWQLDLKTGRSLRCILARKVLSLSPGQCNLVNKM